MDRTTLSRPRVKMAGMEIRPSRSDYFTIILIIIALVLFFAFWGGVVPFFDMLFHRGPA